MKVPRYRRLLLVTGILVLILGAILLSVATRIAPHVRDGATAALVERFRSDVELTTLQVAVFPRPEVHGTGLVLHHKGRTDVPPLIRIESFSASAGLWGIFSSPVRLKSVELEKLHISIPPGGVRPVAGTSGGDPEGPRSPDGPASSASVRPIVDEIVSRSATLEIVPRDPRKLPRVFEIHDLVMRGFGDEGGAAFQAALTNPTPRGNVTTHGTFGPWHAEEPGRTPVRGEYTFEDANLDTIKGIGGILSSSGSYSGALERIAVRGETDTPDFSLDLAGQPVPLTTRFEAVVDGTNGDTWLERVEARLAETTIAARGAVVRARDVKGRRTSLDVTIEDGRIEDVLMLAVKSASPVMTGRMRLKTTLLLPAGDQDVVDKLELSGTFRLDRARFTNMSIQERINTLSRRGKGDTSDEGPNVVSRLSGTFKLRNGRLSFTNLSFAVPGSVVQIAGTYDLRREVLDFRGHLLLDASLAETTTGWKAVAATIAQPLFSRPGGGSKLPIRISGPRQKPEFGLDMRRALGPG
jgi:hypothetical protein